MSDHALSLPQFHRLAGPQPGFQPPCVSKLANVDSWHVASVTQAVPHCQALDSQPLSCSIVRSGGAAAYTAACAARFPGRTTATIIMPMSEATTTVHPIHMVIWGTKAS